MSLSAARKLAGALSWRVATPRICLIRLKNLSTRFRWRQTRPGKAKRPFRFAFGGMLAQALRALALAQTAPVSWPLPAKQYVALAERLGQGVGLHAVGDLSAGQAEGDGAAFGVDERVDFAGKTTPSRRRGPPRRSHAAIVSTPLFPWLRAGEHEPEESRS